MQQYFICIEYSKFSGLIMIRTDFPALRTSSISTQSLPTNAKIPGNSVQRKRGEKENEPLINVMALTLHTPKAVLALGLLLLCTDNSFCIA